MGEQAEWDEQQDDAGSLFATAADGKPAINGFATRSAPAPAPAPGPVREDHNTQSGTSDAGRARDLIPYADAVGKGPTAMVKGELRIPANLSLYAIATQVAQSGYFGDARLTAQAMVKILYGAELGIPPMQSVMGIYLVNGRPAYGSQIMAAAIAQSKRHSYRIRTLTNAECDLEFIVDGESVGHSVFTWDDAKTAGLIGKDNWRKYPRNMLLARAISNGFRWYCADLLGGSPAYTPEELGLMVDGETGEIIDVSPAFMGDAPPPSKPSGPVHIVDFDDGPGTAASPADTASTATAEDAGDDGPPDLFADPK